MEGFAQYTHTHATVTWGITRKKTKCDLQWASDNEQGPSKINIIPCFQSSQLAWYLDSMGKN